MGSVSSRLRRLRIPAVSAARGEHAMCPRTTGAALRSRSVRIRRATSSAAPARTTAEWTSTVRRFAFLQTAPAPLMTPVPVSQERVALRVSAVRRSESVPRGAVSSVATVIMKLACVSALRRPAFAASDDGVSDRREGHEVISRRQSDKPDEPCPSTPQAE